MTADFDGFHGNQTFDVPLHANDQVGGRRRFFCLLALGLFCSSLTYVTTTLRGTPVLTQNP